MPWLNLFAILYGAFYYISLDIPILLISVFSNQSRNAGIILVCLVWETFMFFILMTWGTYAFFIIVSFILTFRDSVDLAMKKMSR